MKKRLTAMLLVVCMLFTFMPMTAFAESKVEGIIDSTTVDVSSYEADADCAVTGTSHNGKSVAYAMWKKGSHYFIAIATSKDMMDKKGDWDENFEGSIAPIAYTAEGVNLTVANTGIQRLTPAQAAPSQSGESDTWIVIELTEQEVKNNLTLVDEDTYTVAFIIGAGGYNLDGIFVPADFVKDKILEQKYSVTYEWSGDAPAEVAAPAAQTGLADGAEVPVASVISPVPGTKDGKNGTWTFNGWTKDGASVGTTVTIAGADIKLIGTWTFKSDSEPDEDPDVTVTKEVAGVWSENGVITLGSDQKLEPGDRVVFKISATVEADDVSSFLIEDEPGADLKRNGFTYTLAEGTAIETEWGWIKESWADPRMFPIGEDRVYETAKSKPLQGTGTFEKYDYGTADQVKVSSWVTEGSWLSKEDHVSTFKKGDTIVVYYFATIGEWHEGFDASNVAKVTANGKTDTTKPVEPPIEPPVQTGGYTVAYYKDGNLVSDDTITKKDLNITDGKVEFQEENLTPADKYGEEYILDYTDPELPSKGASVENGSVFKIYYAKDVIGETDPEKGDGIPDYKQRTLTFTVVGGEWDEGGAAVITKVVTLKTGNQPDGNGSYTVEFPAAGLKPDKDHKAGGNWDVDTTKSVVINKGSTKLDFVFTYNEKPIVNISKELLDPDKQYKNGDSVTYKITVEVRKAADLESITLTEKPGAALLNGAFVLNDGDGNSLIKNLLTGMKAQSGKKKFDAALSGNVLTIAEIKGIELPLVGTVGAVDFADGDTFTFYYTAKLGIGSINPDITVKTVDWDEVEAAVKGLKLPAAIEACVLAKLEPAYEKLLDRVDATVGDLNDLIDKTLQEILGSTTENEVIAKDQNGDELGRGKTDPITSVGIAKPDLTVTKTVKEDKIYAPGDTAEYNINVKNTGDTLLLGMVVTDIPGKGLINGKLDVPEETVDVDLKGGRAVKSFLNGKITVEFKYDWQKMIKSGFSSLSDLQNIFSKDALMAKLQELANMEKPENAGALLGQIEQAMNDFLAKYEWLDVTVYICDRTVAIGRLDEGESLDFTYTATICQMADGKVTNCAVSALGDKSCVTITVKNPEVPVYFYIEGLNNEGYDVDEVIGNDPLSVEEGFVFLNAMLADDCGIKTIVKDDKNVRDWLDAKLSDGYSISIFDLDYLIAKANENDRNALDKNDYKDWAFTQAEWIEGDNAWHVHLKLIPKVVVNLTVDYVDENGNTIQDSKTTQLKEDEGYTIDKSNIVTSDGRTYTCIGWKVNGGELSKDPSVLYSSAIGTSDVTITLVYQMVQADITFYVRDTVITTKEKQDADLTDMPNTHEGYDLIGKKTVGITPKGAALIGADPWYVFDNTNNCKYYFGAYIGANGIVSNAENANTITLGETGNTVKAFSVTVDGKAFTEDNAILKIVKFGYYDDGYHADCIVIPKTTPVVPTAAVYQTEYYFEQEDGSYQKDDAETVRKTASLDALVEAEQKSFDDYAYDETKTAADGLTSGKVFLPEAIKDGDDNVVGVKILTLKLYYSIDKIGGGKDAEEPDQIPDKYEIIVKYTTDGHGTIEKPESKYQTFDVRKLEQNNDGTYTIRLTAEADANSRYKFKSWTGDFQLSGQDATLDADVDAEVGTYVVEANFKKKSSGSSSGEKKPTLNTDEHFQYVMGYTDGTVRPLNKITRAEVAAIFYRLLDDETREYYFTTENDFPDMNDTMWYNKAVSTLANAGIITGCSDGLFHGGRNITRAELATIIAKFDEITYRGEDLFSDISGHWAREYINSSADKGWIVGDGTGKFRPYDDITRAEVMTMINAVLNRAVDEDGLCKGYKKWPDNTKGTWYYYQVIEATNYHEYTWQDGDPEENWTDILPDKTWDEAGR